MKKYILIGLPVLIAAASAYFFIFGQSNLNADSSLFELISDDDVLQLRLETDMTALMEDKSTIDPQPAVLTWHAGEPGEQQLPIKVRFRGNSRKTFCNFPPLKLKFSSETLENRELKPYTSIKLVTHCRSDSTYKQILFKEYLVYKMYAVLSDHAFRVQLTEIEYVNDQEDSLSQKQFGFLLENNKELADRLNARLVSSDEPPVKTIHQDYYKQFVVFQYMVGNTDWNLTNRHNIKVLIPDDNPSPIPIPYDFDCSGLVNAPYAKPYPTMPISSVRERLFQWRGSKDTDFSAVAAKFLEKKEEILGLIKGFYLLSETEKSDMLVYIGLFFEKLENANGVLAASDFMEQSEAN